MALLDRAKAICLKPNTEWPVIEAETSSTSALMMGYAVPLAAIGPIAGFVGGVFIGRTVPLIGVTFHVPLVKGLTMAVVTYLLSLVGIFLLSMIVNALAPTFGGQKNSAQALKVSVYSLTPAFVGGIFGVLMSLAWLGFIAAIYGLYLFYLGLPVLMKNPKEKSLAYTIVVVICAFVIGAVVATVGTMVVGTGAIGAGALSGMSGMSHPSSSSPVQFDKDSFLGKMQAMGKAAQESSKQMEAAQKSGDPNAQAQAAMQGLGAILGGGKRVDPIGIAELKPFIPETFAGLAKTGGSAEKNGVVGFAVSKAEGRYGDHAQKHATLEVTDTGGASGLIGMAGWMNMQGEREDDYSVEKTEKVDGRLVHEKASKRPGGTNEFTVVLGDRFIVNAHGSIALPELKAAVAGLDLGKLEALKSVGVQK